MMNNENEKVKLEVLPLHDHLEYLMDCCKIINNEWKRSDTARLHSLKSSCKELPTSLILLRDRILIGHSKLSIIPSMTNACFVESVVIDENFRGQGYGSYLMKETEEYCRNILSLDRIYLSTKGQEPFYCKLGYTECLPVSIYGNHVSKSLLDHNNHDRKEGMNSSLDKLVINVHKISENEAVLWSLQFKMDPHTKVPISRTYFTSSAEENFNCSRENKLTLTYERFKIHSENINCVKVENFENSGLIAGKPVLNIPTMIRCQNCETNFPTRYQYQRHQCEFDAEKVVLKPETDCSNIDPNDTNNKGDKHICELCDKQFVNKNNLERHQASHEIILKNICEHCDKQFVTENRLRIHKENHCKKAGDVSKFYRSDVAVWKCRRCHEVFSSPLSAKYHTSVCMEYINYESAELSDGKQSFISQNGEKRSIIPGNENADIYSDEDKTIEKVQTELLLQCEFCNRTYAEKNVLLMHQRKHTTVKNYECVNCSQVFDSYITAAQHWMKKCTEYVSLFYLPKFTFCEYCNRTFKSHELLYTHKIKKKHYTPKFHESCDLETDIDSSIKEKSVDNKEILNKLIEDVLKTLDVPITKLSNTYTSSIQINNNNQPIIDIAKIKMENEECESSHSFELTEKRRRGRKRKYPNKNQMPKLGKLNYEIEEGYKYQCERCVKVFENISNLEKHRDKEHAANFTCEDCGQVLQSAKALLIHSRAHKCLKPYVCETCGRSYSQTSHLWQHMRFHQGIKPFACPHEGCEARYTIRPDLKDHIRKVHTRERPFKCNVCDKCFLTGSVYYQHRLIHTNDRRYACDLCPKRFFRADALNNHRRIHTDERPYPCHVCGREFRQKGDRNKHIRTQHPDTMLMI
ncbi:unnamed protein product [Phaedon cochleariae]|uniref:Uncharacterized protein n=1 Tax=Phaedon cochleariae TaxID=80249 RepID=A0A9P0GVQ3_PHACE|nr:unnamed protein product [Phaedon cochleariae]